MRYITALLFPLIALPATTFANDYPTYDRVLYVLNCMQDIGDQTMENLYTCTCRIDSIAEQMVFLDYGLGDTYERGKRMSGEKGGVVRDNPLAKKSFAKLEKARKVAEQECPNVVRVKNPSIEE